MHEQGAEDEREDHQDDEEGVGHGITPPPGAEAYRSSQGPP